MTRHTFAPLLFLGLLFVGCDGDGSTFICRPHAVPSPILIEVKPWCYAGADVGPCSEGHDTETRIDSFRSPGHGIIIDGATICVHGGTPFEVLAVVRCTCGAEAQEWIRYE